MTNTRAINLLKGLEQSLDGYCELNDEGKAAFRMAITALELFGNAEQLPSAQPEIVRCKDCIRYGKDNCFMKIQMLWELKPDDFCSYAERRTDDEQ